MLKECLTIKDTRMGVNYGLNKLRFPAPVPVGRKIQLGARLNEVKEIEGGFQIVVGFNVSVVGDAKPCAVGEAIYNYYS